MLYLGLVNYGGEEQPRYIVQFEELLNNDIFSFNFSAFKRKFSREKSGYMGYKKFHGQWAEPIVPQSFFYLYIKSKSEYIDSLFPSLELKMRYDQWEGYTYHYIIYELSDGDRTGYALYCSDNPQIHKTAMRKADDIEYCAVEYYASYKKCTSIPFNSYRFMGNIICDGIMLELLIKRIEQHKKNGWKHRQVHNKLCIAEHDLKYFWVTKYIKDRNPLQYANDVFNEIHSGLYDNLQRYEYLIQENKWKSEQLVYELTKKAYKKHTVLYQYRPFFLRSEKGQMSYDIFICGINVAIEYQGKQHFEPVDIFGGKDHFKSQVIRDKLKMKLSKDNGVSLVYINYWEDISIDLIEKRVNEALEENASTMSPPS